MEAPHLLLFVLLGAGAPGETQSILLVGFGDIGGAGYQVQINLPIILSLAPSLVTFIIVPLTKDSFIFSFHWTYV